MASTFFITIILFLFYSSSPASSQQPYEGTGTYNCNLPQPNTTITNSSLLGYTCSNGVASTCSTYLIFRSTPPYTSVSSIAALLSVDPSLLAQANNVSSSSLFPRNTLVIIPITCSCTPPYYQSNTSYTSLLNDTYSDLASFTFQSLSTCQSILALNDYPSPTLLLPSTTLTIPLRCSCPSQSQSDSGFDYLLTYPVVSGDSLSIISTRFGIDLDSALQANQMTTSSSEIYTLTTLLLPLQRPPNSSLIQTTLPPSSPPPPPRRRPFSSRRRQRRKWVAPLRGALVGIVVFLTLLGALCLYVFRRSRSRRRRGRAEVPLAGGGGEEVEGGETAAAMEFIKEATTAAVTESFKVYSLEELKRATEDFSEGCRIGGSVYRGRLKGDWAAIKRMGGGDPSKEMRILKSVNHKNIIRLCGFCYGEGEWYMVYEYAGKGALREWIHGGGERRGVLRWGERVRIAADVAAGMGYMHRQVKPAYVHGNLTSGCVMVDEEGRGKVGGMGRGREGEGVTRNIVGTMGYMAPEYLEKGMVSSGMDVYALGVVLLEMVTGREASEVEWGEVFGWWEMAGEEERKRRLVLVRDERMMGGGGFDDGWEETAVLVVGLAGKCLRKNPSLRPSMDDISTALSAILISAAAAAAARGG